MEHVQIGEIEVPFNYFELDNTQQEELCMGLIETMITMLDKQLPIYLSRFEILYKLLESSIITNLEEEKYEIVAILERCKQIMDEQKD